MNCSLSSISARTSPSTFHINGKHHFIPMSSKHTQKHVKSPPNGVHIEPKNHHLWSLKTSTIAIQAAAILAAVEQPALAVTGVNNEEELSWVLIQSGIVAFGYFLVVPPIILNWLRLRWYKRRLLEMYVQFMCVFIFFPGILLWAPFVNFRRLPRDPTMKYPWSTPQDPPLTDSQTP
ncbi:hypothetical protein ACHQM5_030807 [Ranunculus cassubicifolius]